MRVPKKPPAFFQFADSLEELTSDHMRLSVKLATDTAVLRFIQEVNNKYLHWDKLRLYPMPADLKALEAWILVWLNRQNNRQNLPLTFQGQNKLWFVLPPKHLEWLQKIDRQAGASGLIFGSLQDDNDRYLTNSLMEEAIASSQLEGASTTREIAKEMLRTDRAPRDKAEQMIVNNYRTILEIREELKKEQLTPAMLCHLQEMLTERTLASPHAAGRFRKSEEPVRVVDVRTGEVLYEPPDAHEIAARIEEICVFANTESDPFVHPVIKAMALHFAIGFVHPFVDGNGRTARALFFWYLLKEKYDAFEYLPISRILMRAPMKYVRAYLYTETDSGDLTYFNHHQFDVILRAISNLEEYLKVQKALRREAAQLVQAHPELNFRQGDVVRYLLDHPGAAFSIPAYAGKYRITYPTAKGDLEGLLKAAFVEKFKRGRTTCYRPVPQLAKSIAKAKKTRSQIAEHLAKLPPKE